MARREMSKVADLLPRVLARVAEETGSARQLAPIWEEVAGPAIARSAVPCSWERGTLLLRVPDPGWARELEGRERELLDRLASRLGPDAVKRLVFRVG